MIQAFPQRYPTTLNYKNHPFEEYRGFDKGTPMITPILMMNDYHLRFYISNDLIDGVLYKTPVLEMYNNNELWRLVHIDSCIVPNGFYKEGTLVGYTGNKGYTTGAHTHIEYYVNGVRMDGEKLFDSLPLISEVMDTNKRFNFAIANFNYKKLVVIQGDGDDKNLQYAVFDEVKEEWTEFMPLDGKTEREIYLVEELEGIWLHVRGLNGQMYSRFWDGTNWSKWYSTFKNNNQ